MQALNKKTMEGLFRKILKQSPEAFGEFEYNGIRILVKKPKLMLGRERSKRLYDSRRARGLCVHCGAKVRSKNRFSGAYYRLCDFHREKELARKKLLRKEIRLSR